jgi:hypothetical protein
MFILFTYMSVYVYSTYIYIYELIMFIYVHKHKIGKRGAAVEAQRATRARDLHCI